MAICRNDMLQLNKLLLTLKMLCAQRFYICFNCKKVSTFFPILPENLIFVANILFINETEFGFGRNCRTGKHRTACGLRKIDLHISLKI